MRVPRKKVDENENDSVADRDARLRTLAGTSYTRNETNETNESLDRAVLADQMIENVERISRWPI